MSLNREQFLKAYRKMRTIRDFENRVHDEFMQGNIPGFTHLYAGQEAIATAACLDLSDEDYIGSTHRGHGHCIAKGCDVPEMMLEIMGKKGGSCGGKGGSMHIADISKGMLGANAIVGGGPPLAVGAALSCKTLDNKNIALSFTGDGGSNQGTTFEAMNLAVVLKLPCVFVYENNGYGEGTGAEYTVGSKDIAGRAAGFGMPAAKVDGSDIFSVYDAMKEAVDRARRGEGPSAVEASITRFYGHFEGDPQLYRASDEVDNLKRDMDCLKISRQQAIEKGLATAEEMDAIDSDVAQLIDQSAKAAVAAPFPDAAELHTDVYSSAY